MQEWLWSNLFHCKQACPVWIAGTTKSCGLVQWLHGHPAQSLAVLGEGQQRAPMCWLLPTLSQRQWVHGSTASSTLKKWAVWMWAPKPTSTLSITKYKHVWQEAYRDFAGLASCPGHGCPGWLPNTVASRFLRRRFVYRLLLTHTELRHSLLSNLLNWGQAERFLSLQILLPRL